MQSIKSNALEPTRTEMATLSAGRRILRILPVYGLPILTLLLIVVFSLLLPDTFPTAMNVRSILSNQSIIALLALAAMVPMMAGRIDLTVGFGIVLWHIMAISLQVWYGVPWPLAILIVFICACVFGAINGLLVEIAQIDSFIATLGTGTILYSLALWLTGGQQVIGKLDPAFIATAMANVGEVPILAVYVGLVALVMWVIAERLPVGRYIYAIGANEKAAALNGIPVRSYVIGTFIYSSALTALTGCLMAAKFRVGQASVGLDFLLPALVGAFLGSTTIKPGRVNVWGTIIGVLILAVGVSGIQQLGGAFFVEPLFNGGTLIVSIGIAGFAQRRRGNARHIVPVPTRAAEVDASSEASGTS